MRLKIGLIFSYDEKWIGGTYYIINLIQSLEKIDNEQKPELIILSNRTDFDYLKNSTSYEFLSFERLDENPELYFFRLVNRISQKILRKKIIVKRCSKELDVIFPYVKNNYLSNVPLRKRVYWIPDFQEKYFPENYSPEHLANEITVNSWIVSNAQRLVLSSETALRDLSKYYKGFTANPYVVRFASFARTASSHEIDFFSKFKLPKQFFYSPNQFWSHKNHITVIKAVEILKYRGIEIVVIFSGKEYDSRNPKYTEGLKSYVTEKQLEHNILFLGFLERSVQLELLEHCYAVIQPSLFEGWSTVIEEAMLFNKVVIASDIDVNREQLENNGLYFKRNDATHLAEIIVKVLNALPTLNYDYESKQLKFAESFLECVKGN